MDTPTPIKKMFCSAKNAGKKTIKTYDLLKGLSIKNKASFDIQVKSDKSCLPLSHRNYSYNKEFKVMPIIYVLTGIIALCTVCKIMMCKKK